MRKWRELPMKLSRRSKIFLLAFGAIIFLFLIFEIQSPAYLFINDTPERITGTILGTSSPGIHIDLKPGENKIIPTSFLQGQLQLIKTESSGRVITSSKNFLILRVVQISKLPKY